MASGFLRGCSGRAAGRNVRVSCEEQEGKVNNGQTKLNFALGARDHISPSLFLSLSLFHFLSLSFTFFHFLSFSFFHFLSRRGSVPKLTMETLVHEHGLQLEKEASARDSLQQRLTQLQVLNKRQEG